LRGFHTPPCLFEWMMQGHCPSQFLKKHHVVWCQPPIVECQEVAITMGKWSVQLEVVWPPPLAKPPFENNVIQPQHYFYVEQRPSLHFILAKIGGCSKSAHSSHNDPEP
jgi:hypothetical protein